MSDSGSVVPEGRSWSGPRQWPEPLPSIALDTHGHLSDLAFASDMLEVWQRAQTAKVGYILDPGVDVISSRRAVDNARRFPGTVRAAAGIHPHEAAVATGTDWRDLEQLAKLPEVVAIGEIGLDAYREISPTELQEKALERCLAIAQEVQKPVLLHVRATYGRMLEILGTDPPVRGILHAFWADRATAEQFIGRGFVLGFGGALTFRREASLRDVARSLPDGSFVFETDMPYLSPQPVRGSRCESALIAFTARVMAEVRNEPLEDVVRRTTSTGARLFPHWPQLVSGGS